MLQFRFPLETMSRTDHVLSADSPRPVQASEVSVAQSIEPAEVNEEWVLTKCDHFTDMHLWPTHTRIDPKGWLSNFTQPEKEHAIHLLNSVLYFSEPLVDQLFVAAFRSLSQIIGLSGSAASRGTGDMAQFHQQGHRHACDGRNPVND